MNLNDNCKSLLADTNFLFYFSLLKEQTKKENQQRMQLQLHLRWQRLQLQSYSMQKWMPRLELLIQGRSINSFVVWSSPSNMRSKTAHFTCQPPLYEKVVCYFRPIYYYFNYCFMCLSMINTQLIIQLYMLLWAGSFCTVCEGNAWCGITDSRLLLWFKWANGRSNWCMEDTIHHFLSSLTFWNKS